MHVTSYLLTRSRGAQHTTSIHGMQQHPVDEEQVEDPTVAAKRTPAPSLVTADLRTNSATAK